MKKYFPLILLLLAQFACRREDSTSWSVDLALPVAHAHLTLSDIVTDSLLVADENGLWHLRIHNDLTDFALDSIVAIPDTLIHKGFSPDLSGGPFPIPPGQQLITQNVNTVLALNDVELKEVRIKSGTMQYFIKSYTGAYLDCSYSLPGVTLYGIPVVLSAATSPGTDANPFVQSGNINLAGYRIDLSGPNGNLKNTIASSVDISISNLQPGNAMIFGDDSVAVELHFVDPIVEYARGYFGYHEYSLDQGTSFGNDLPIPQGALNLDQVFFHFNVENYTGADARVDFTELKGIHGGTSQSFLLENADIYDAINITRAFDNNGTVVPVIKEYVLDNSNSNIDQFVEFLPDSIYLSGEVVINPLGDVSDGNDFIYTDQALNASMDLDIPLCVGMQGLVLTDTLNITSESDADISGKFFVDVTNAFPFSATMDLALVDYEGEVIAQLIQGGTIAASGIPGDEHPVQSHLVFNFAPGTFQMISPANHFALKIAFSTPNFNEPVKIYDTYYMNVDIRAEARVGVEVN